MNFFEHQEQARRKSWQLGLLFSLAVGSLIAGIYLIVKAILAWIYTSEATVFSYSYLNSNPQDRSWWNHLWEWDVQAFSWVTLITLLIVTVGSIYKTIQLRSGGPAVAASLGGRIIRSSTRDDKERQLLNVVVEMAIASGTPTPGVYLLEKEQGINAFAAGYSPDDAVIGVTQGALDHLTREELQGVIGHEFSHILNGDMRLNIHLMSLIHGILIIGLTGEVLVRGSSRRHYAFRMTKNSGKEAFALMLLGLCLMATGYLGVFFGNLIKAAVSRQREYLADASSAQFTRHPSGLANALKKIGGWKRGSIIRDPQSQTVSHMFFSQAFTSSFSTLLATHPSLPARIRRLDPTFDGQYISTQTSDVSSSSDSSMSPASPLSLDSAVPINSDPQALPQEAQIPNSPIASIGNPTPAHLIYAQQLLQSLPDSIRTATEDPFGARALVYALLIQKEESFQEIQMAQLHAHADPAVYRETVLLLPFIRTLEPQARLPVIDMLLPTLQSLSYKQYLSFKKNLESLIQADRQTDLFEWAMRQVLLQHLEPFFRKVKKPMTHFYSLQKLEEPCAVLLSALAYQTGGNQEDVLLGFGKALEKLSFPSLVLVKKEDCSIPRLDMALETIQKISFNEKQALLDACAACVLSNDHISAGEGELLRALADSLGCPMPPLLTASFVGEFVQHH